MMPMFSVSTNDLSTEMPDAASVHSTRFMKRCSNETIPIPSTYTETRS
jgi:hypothetical protein